jgi:hypothetical protein
MSKSEAHSFYKEDVMDDVHSNIQLPGQPYRVVGLWTLTLLLCDADKVVEPLQEACLEYLMSNPLGFVPLLDNPWRPIVALAPPLLTTEWEKYQEVGKVPHLCHQTNFVFSLWTTYIKKKHLHMIKFIKTFKRKKLCTSYQVPPTEYPPAGLSPDLLRNPTWHKHNRRPSTSVVTTSRRRYHYT